MNFICFIGGIVVGLLIRRHETAIDKATDRFISTLTVRERKGAIIEPKSEERVAMEELFARNDANGEDTEIGHMESDE